MRLYRVLDTRLAEHEFLVEDHSVADIAHFAWVRAHEWAGPTLDGLLQLEQ